MRTATVIGVDPGGTTGLACVRFTPGAGYTLAWTEQVTGDVRAVMDTIARMEVRLIWDHDPAVDPPELPPPPFIAVERFVVLGRASRTASAGASQKARDIIGAIEAGYPGRVTRATAAEAKGWATDKRLTVAWVKPRGRHARDAARHALYTHVKRLGNPDPLSSAYPGGAS